MLEWSILSDALWSARENNGVVGVIPDPQFGRRPVWPDSGSVLVLLGLG
jgi:hypothetical protein